jgi:tetratricopeptide (TPR) repeat protein
LDAARRGEGGVVTIFGEAGIGKTALLDHALAAVKSPGIFIMRVPCTEGSVEPMAPFVQAFGRTFFSSHSTSCFEAAFAVGPTGEIVAQGSGDGIDVATVRKALDAVQSFVSDSFGGAGGKLGRLEVGDVRVIVERAGGRTMAGMFRGREAGGMAEALRDSLRAPVPDIAALLVREFALPQSMASANLTEERARMAALVAMELRRRVTDRPLCLAVEDIHWSDELTAHALSYLARNAAKDGYLLIVTARTEGLPSAISDLPNVQDAVHIALGPLDTDSVRAIVREISPGTAEDAGAIERLAARTGGNPFFLVETLASAPAAGVVELPESVRDVVQRRLEAVDAESASLAEYASCVGIEFELGLLPDGAERWLSGLESSGIVRGGEGRYRFAHALFRDAIYASLSERWRAAHHRAIGLRYETEHAGRLGDVAFELAAHFSRSSDKSRAWRYCLAAAENAEGAYAAATAVELYTSAMSAGVGLSEVAPVERIRVAVRRADALRALGRWDEAEEAYTSAMRDADAAGERVVGAEASMRFGALLRDRGRTKEAAPLLACAAEVMGSQGEPEQVARALVELAGLKKLVADLDGAMAGYAKALDIATRAGDEGGQAVAIGGVAGIMVAKGDYRKALEMYGDQMRVVEKLGDKRVKATILGDMGFAHNELAEYRKAMECLGAKMALSTELGDRYEVGKVANTMGLCMYYQSEFEEAQKHFSMQLAVARELGDKMGEGVALGNMGIVYRPQGKYAEAMECQERRLRISEEIGDRRGVSASLANIGVIHALSGRYGEAKANFERRLAIVEEMGDKRGLVITLENLGNLAAIERDWRRSSELYDRATALAKESGHRYYQCEVANSKSVMLLSAHESGVEGALSEARELNATALEMSKELKRSEILFEATLLRARLEGLNDIGRGMAMLAEALASAKDDQQSAAARYELFRLGGNKSDGMEALALYKTLCDRTPNAEWASRAAEIGKKLAKK